MLDGKIFKRPMSRRSSVSFESKIVYLQYILRYLADTFCFFSICQYSNTIIYTAVKNTSVPDFLRSQHFRRTPKYSNYSCVSCYKMKKKV